MAAHRALLTFALAAAVIGGRVGATERRAAESCGACHPVHYAELGTCLACHRGDGATKRKDLAHHRLIHGSAAAWAIPGSGALDEGARLRDRSGCRRCHVTGGRGNRLAIALDRVVWRRDQEELRQSILEPVSAMPDFAFTAEQADRLIAVLLRDGDRHGVEERYEVRFRQTRLDGPHPFQKLCGPCHRALTRLGPMGVGRSGPDLSGLMTIDYPTTDGRRWDRARLRRWLDNPRAERPGTLMRPVKVREDELDRVVEVLDPERPR